ncbi:NAD-dependent epimerase/dehydratase family protein [Nocardia sp. CA-135398]|uniref:NAD-dependent epimerase/dehydratase family protein n=1 Tax=Nocardia sp. CA-135398 TaxID=3239977 RepID=UPI003D954FE6
MPQILITSGGGPVGLNTARALVATGASVVLNARRGHDTIEKALGEHRQQVAIESVDLSRSGEVFDLFSRYNFDAVIHTAAAHQHAQRRVVNRANYDMLFNCLEAAQATGVTRFVHVSSIVVYAGLQPPFNEDQRFPVETLIDDHPNAMGAIDTPDGGRVLAVPEFEVCVKRSLECIALDYAAPWRMGGSATVPTNQNLNEHQLEVAVLRLTSQFGPGYKEMGSPISRAVHTAAGRGNLMAGAGYFGVPLPQLWSMIAASPLTYVRDTANALARVVGADTLAHRIYNLSSGYTTSAREQLLALYQIRPDAARQVGMDPETLRAEPYPSGGFNADLLTRDTGWRPQFTFEEALEDYLSWLSENPY